MAASSAMRSTSGFGASSSSSMPSSTGNSVKFDMCVQALTSGCVGAFVSLFTLSHRDPVCVDELAQVMFTIPDERLPWVLDRLTAAELKRRRSDFRGVFEENMLLSDYFEAEGDKAQAIRHHVTALQSCTDSLDRVLEGEAHERTAQLYERLGMLAEAAVHFEAKLRIAELVQQQAVPGSDQAVAAAADFATSSRCLIHVYLARGEATLREGRYEVARELFEKAVGASRACGDHAFEAQAYSSLGNVTVLLGDMRKALEYQKRYLIVARETHDGAAESAAALEVAKLQESLGQVDEAVTSLKDALMVAESSNDLPAINEACKLLGDAYRKQPGQLYKAVHYLREHFRVSTDLGDTAAIDEARISLGMAHGQHHFTTANNGTGFLNLVVDDLPTLLEWLGTGTL